ncbi:MAG: class I adenylate-forming enzyme family protein [Gammaproteobacteria bacterium]
MSDLRPDTAASPAIEHASALTIGELLRTRTKVTPEAVALTEGDRRVSYAQFNDRVNRLANALSAQGLIRGERLAVLSENRIEYMECVYAAAKLGAIVCALNWRLVPGELQHCIGLTAPHLVFASARHANLLQRQDLGCVKSVLRFDGEYEALVAGSPSHEPEIAARPEDGLLILYTSGTTGLPKGALISHRAEIARMFVNAVEMGLDTGTTFVGWLPMYHMGCMDQAIASLSVGATVAVVDGFDVERIVTLVETERLWWLALLPGTIDRFCEAMKRRNARPRHVHLVGAMADLVPRRQIAERTRLLGAPYANTCGSTETGIPPA